MELWEQIHNKAIFHHKKGEHAQSIEHAKKALILNQNIDTLKCLVLSLFHIGKKEESLRASELCRELEIYLELEKDCRDDSQMAKFYFKNKRYKNAINVLANRLTNSDEARAPHRALVYAIYSHFTSTLDPAKRLALAQLRRHPDPKLSTNIIFADKCGLSRGEEDSRPQPGCSPYQETPLSKIDELLELCNFIGINPQDFHLIDLGGGKGISTLFFAHRCNFKSLTSLEIQNKLSAIARENVAAYNASNNKSIDIHFLEKDASTIRLKDQPYFIFAYNPFSESIWESFIERNIDIFSNHKAIIALYNPRCLNITHKHCDVIGSSSFGQCMILRFQKTSK